MGVSGISILSYALWPLLTLPLVALWIAALLDIKRSKDDGRCTKTRLISMATAVSVATLIAVFFVSVIFPPWYGSVSRKASDTSDCKQPTQSYVFSFGLEHAAIGTCPAYAKHRHLESEQDLR